MIILQATGITKSYGVDMILDGVTFQVNAGDRLGIIGANGAGKTTLMDILAGDSEPDSGNVFMSNEVTLGYLRQHDNFDDNRTVMEEVHGIFAEFEKTEKRLGELTARISDLASRGLTDTEEYTKVMKQYGNLQDLFEREGGFSYKSEMRGILNSMAFGENYYDMPICSLSGGERTRLSLACLLMKKPDILMLDEPTNHLDIGMLKWLEQFLKLYKGTVIMVSHDRYFLDQICTGILEIENHRILSYKGNYTEFARKKQEKRMADLKLYEKQQDEIRRQEDMIRRFKERGTEHLAKRAASREKQLAHMEKVEKPETDDRSIKVRFHQNFKSGNDVLHGEDVGQHFGEGPERKDLFSGASFHIRKGERVCIVGANGIGKTTLLKILMGEILPSEGFVRRGHQVEFGYYDQRQQALTGTKTVMDEVHDSFRLYKDSEIRAILGRFLFTGDDVLKEVASLSGGEKARLALLKLMLSGANVLVLDEPTNHLDIESKEVFEEALLDYPGTIIAVSHDRYFLNRIATRIFELGNLGITSFEGGYDYYEEKSADIKSGKNYIGELREAVSEELPESEEEPKKTLSAAEERALKKKEEAEERRRQRKIKDYEERIAELEDLILEIQEEMCLPENISNVKTLRELNEKLDDSKLELDECYEGWSELAE